MDRNNQLAGDIWFYYGSRYGEYLGDTKQGNPEDFLPAVLEQSPGSSAGYEGLADYYVESGETRSAIEDYKHALELSSAQADIHERLALAYYKDGKRTEAIAEWKLVFSTLLKQVNSARVPESFWSDFGRACDHVHSRKLFAAVKPDVDTLARAYLHRNGNYRSNALLQSAYTADRRSCGGDNLAFGRFFLSSRPDFGFVGRRGRTVDSARTARADLPANSGKETRHCRKSGRS